MFTKSLLVLSSALLASALPAHNSEVLETHNALSRRQSAPTATLPSSSLPAAPPSGMSLKYITLGIGTQNYTCASSPNSGTAPASVGALATLYDVSMVLDNVPQAIPALPALANYIQVNSEMLGSLPQLGHHFFTGVNGVNTPTFDLSAVNAFLSAKKVGDIAAPSGSYPGPKQEGAVDWLYLTSDSSGLSKGLGAVYRVETAGGKQPSSCNGISGAFTVPYSAEYWFYG